MRGQDGADRRGAWKFWLRLGVSLGLLALLASQVPDLDGVLPKAHYRLTIALLVAAVAVSVVGVVLSAWRWRRVLDAFDADAPVGILAAHHFAGLFVGNVLPSTIGGDVLRVSRVSKTVGSPTTGFASVAIERLTGFLALPVLVLAGFALQPSLLEQDRAWVALLIAGITLGLLGAILLAAGHPRIAGRYAANENWTRFIGAVHVGVDRMRREPGKAAGVMVSALVYQISVVVSVGLLFRTLDLPVPVAAVIAFVPAVAMAQVLPISVSGLGVREGMLVLFLTPFGVSSGQAIAVGLLWYACTLATSMLGAPAFAVGYRHRAPEPPEPAPPIAPELSDSDGPPCEIVP